MATCTNCQRDIENPRSKGKYCGRECSRLARRRPPNYSEGDTVGMLKLVRFERRKIRNRERVFWLCECRCGRTKWAVEYSLGSYRSCGCENEKRCSAGFRKTHGMRGTSEYSIWSGIKSRCLNPRCHAYANYGGRGIKISQSWIGANGFSAFLADMGSRPPGMTIERQDVNGDYTPGNCVWASRRTQGLNRRNTLYITLNGEILPLKIAAQRTGVNYYSARNRLRRGLAVEDILRA
jgi:hypothetical protein